MSDRICATSPGFVLGHSRASDKLGHASLISCRPQPHTQWSFDANTTLSAGSSPHRVTYGKFHNRPETLHSQDERVGRYGRTHQQQQPMADDAGLSCRHECRLRTDHPGGHIQRAVHGIDPPRQPTAQAQAQPVDAWSICASRSMLSLILPHWNPSGRCELHGALRQRPVKWTPCHAKRCVPS
jgi:hypothetical protein